MFGSLTATERQTLIRKMRNAMLTNRIEAEALIGQPAAASGITADQALMSLAECANVVLGMYPDPDPEPPLTDGDRAILAGAAPLAGLVAAFDAEADRMRATMGQQDDPMPTDDATAYRIMNPGRQQDTGTGWPA
jgi:hypothetical protein